MFCKRKKCLSYIKKLRVRLTLHDTIELVADTLWWGSQRSFSDNRFKHIHNWYSSTPVLPDHGTTSLSAR